MKKFVEVTSSGHKEVEEFDILFWRSRSKVEGLKYPKLTSPKKKSQGLTKLGEDNQQGTQSEQKRAVIICIFRSSHFSLLN